MWIAAQESYLLHGAFLYVGGVPHLPYMPLLPNTSHVPHIPHISHILTTPCMPHVLHIPHMPHTLSLHISQFEIPGEIFNNSFSIWLHSKAVAEKWAMSNEGIEKILGSTHVHTAKVIEIIYHTDLVSRFRSISISFGSDPELFQRMERTQLLWICSLYEPRELRKVQSCHKHMSQTMPLKPMVCACSAAGPHPY